jgi:hypothetical protein
MRYIDNQFEWPILWRIGAGPRALRSLEEALDTIDHRLEEIEGRLVYSDEVTSLIALRDVVETASHSLQVGDIQKAVDALRSFAMAYRPMVAIPRGKGGDMFFAYQDAISKTRARDADAADA